MVVQLLRQSSCFMAEGQRVCCGDYAHIKFDKNLVTMILGLLPRYYFTRFV